MCLLTSGSDGSAIVETGAPGIWCALFALIPFISGTMSTAIHCTLAAFECQLVQLFFFGGFLFAALAMGTLAESSRIFTINAALVFRRPFFGDEFSGTHFSLW